MAENFGNDLFALLGYHRDDPEVQAAITAAKAADYERAMAEVERLREALSEAAADLDEELRAENERLRAMVDFWDHFYDEAFPNDPYLLGAMRAEVDRLETSRSGSEVNDGI